MSEFIRLQANGVDAFPDASTENTYRPNGTSVESALLALESNVNTLGGVAGEAKTLAEQNSVKIATAEQEISDINSSLTDSGWLTLTTGVYYRKKNGYVTVNNTNDELKSTGSDLPIGNLPEGFRPQYTVLQKSFNEDSWMQIDTNGNIGLLSSSGAFDTRCIVTFPVD